MNWFNFLQGPFITRTMLKQAAYWGTTLWLLVVLVGLVRKLLIVSG